MISAILKLPWKLKFSPLLIIFNNLILHTWCFHLLSTQVFNFDLLPCSSALTNKIIHITLVKYFHTADNFSTSFRGRYPGYDSDENFSSWWRPTDQWPRPLVHLLQQYTSSLHFSFEIFYCLVTLLLRWAKREIFKDHEDEKISNTKINQHLAL